MGKGTKLEGEGPVSGAVFNKTGWGWGGSAQDRRDMEMIVICRSPGRRWQRWPPGCCLCQSGSAQWTWRRRRWWERTWTRGAGGCCSLLHLCYEEQEESRGQRDCGGDSWMNQEQQSLRAREDNLEMSPFLVKMSNLKSLF